MLLPALTPAGYSGWLVRRRLPRGSSRSTRTLPNLNTSTSQHHHPIRRATVHGISVKLTNFTSKAVVKFNALRGPFVRVEVHHHALVLHLTPPIMATSKTPMLESIFHHVALPPKLPNRQEAGLEAIGQDLTKILLSATVSLRDSTYEKYGPELDCVRRAISNAKTLNAGGKLNKGTLLSAFRELQGNYLLIIHVSEQNAALLVRRIVK